MERKGDGLRHISEAFGGLDGLAACRTNTESKT